MKYVIFVLKQTNKKKPERDVRAQRLWVLPMLNTSSFLPLATMGTKMLDWLLFFPQMCQSSSQAQLSLSLPMNSFFTVSALKSVWPSICCTYTFTMRSHILRVRVLWAWVVCSLTFLFFYDHRKTLLSLIGSADPGNLICFYQPA